MEEQLLVVQLHRVNIRVGSAQSAYGVVDHVAFDSKRTTMGNNMGRLVWQMFCWINDFAFDCNFVADVGTMLNLFNLPSLFCHMSLRTLMPVV